MVNYLKYLKSFVIGSSALVTLQHFAFFNLIDDNYYDFNFKAYSLYGPFYFGILAVIAKYLIGSYEFSLRAVLFVFSILSISGITLLNYFISRHFYKPYKNFSGNEWINYILVNGARHLIIFNMVIYYLEQYFNFGSGYLKSFVIGSSLPVYILFFLSQINANRENFNYSYKNYVLLAPLYLGLINMVSLWLAKMFSLSLRGRYLLIGILSPIIVFLIARTWKAYKFSGSDVWWKYFGGLLLAHFLVFNIIVYGLEYYL